MPPRSAHHLDRLARFAFGKEGEPLFIVNLSIVWHLPVAPHLNVSPKMDYGLRMLQQQQLHSPPLYSILSENV